MVVRFCLMTFLKLDSIYWVFLVILFLSNDLSLAQRVSPRRGRVQQASEALTASRDTEKVKEIKSDETLDKPVDKTSSAKKSVSEESKTDLDRMLNDLAQEVGALHKEKRELWEKLFKTASDIRSSVFAAVVFDKKVFDPAIREKIMAIKQDLQEMGQALQMVLNELDTSVGKNVPFAKREERPAVVTYFTPDISKLPRREEDFMGSPTPAPRNVITPEARQALSLPLSAEGTAAEPRGTRSIPGQISGTGTQESGMPTSGTMVAAMVSGVPAASTPETGTQLPTTPAPTSASSMNDRRTIVIPATTTPAVTPTGPTAPTTTPVATVTTPVPGSAAVRATQPAVAGTPVTATTTPAPLTTAPTAAMPLGAVPTEQRPPGLGTPGAAATQPSVPLNYPGTATRILS